MTADDPDHYWRWHDRMGLSRPGGPAQRERQVAVAKDGAITAIYHRKPKKPPKFGPLPVVVPREKPKADPTVILRWQDRAHELRTALADINKKLDGEWADYEAGISPMPHRGGTKKIWQDITSDLARVEHLIIPHEIERAANPAAFGPREVPQLLVQLGKLREKRRCYWCADMVTLFTSSREHIIPRWIRKHLGMRSNEGVALACRSCNEDKGGMPPAVFHRVRHNAHETTRQRELWGGICHRIQEGEEGALLEYAMSEMRVPIPGRALPKPAVAGPVNPPHSKNKPLKRLYYPTPLALKTWEELNPETRDDRPL